LNSVGKTNSVTSIISKFSHQKIYFESQFTKLANVFIVENWHCSNSQFQSSTV